MIKEIIKRLESEKGIVNIGLFTHKNCDYDAICSTLTLGNYLKEVLGNKIEVYPILDQYKFNLKVNSSISNYNNDIKVVLDYGIVCDVNEQDLLYGDNLFNTIKFDNRYLFDHHTGNRLELNVPNNNKLVKHGGSSTCEVIAEELFNISKIDNLKSYNLYLGMAADTVGFNIQVTSITMEISNKLNLSFEQKEMIKKEVSSATDLQRSLFKRISKETIDIDGLNIYKLLLNSDEEDIVKELCGLSFEEIITPVDLDTISFLLIECGTTVYFKLRKNQKSNLDIVKLAMKCNGGGHDNRCAGRLYDMNYIKALEYVCRQYMEQYDNGLIKIILATNNKSKLKEIRQILTEFKIMGLRDANINIDVIENQDTFYKNALKKAKEIYEVGGIPVIADDSGLCIDKYNNWPGVMTHRFLGDNKTDEERNIAIINKMKDLVKEERKASFVCNLVYYDGVNIITGEGMINGYISTNMRGENGFGFDTIFELSNGKTLAELTQNEKNEVSARALAAQDLKKKILKI